MATAKVTYKSSKIPGVRFNSRSKKYEALYTKYLGSFDTVDQASKARDSFIKKVTPEKPKAEKKAAKPKAPKVPKAEKKVKAEKKSKPKSEQYANEAHPVAAA